MRKAVSALLCTLLLGSLSCTPAKMETPNQVSGDVVPFNQNSLVLDFKANLLPFPNDVVLSQTNGTLYIDPSVAQDNGTKALYEALDALKLKGFSPMTFISVPLLKDTKIEHVAGNFRLFDLTALKECQVYGVNCSLIDQTDRLLFKQDGKSLKFYPVKPLEAGHSYIFVLKKGLMDASGYHLTPPQMFTMLTSSTPLSDPRLEALRQIYYNLAQQVIPSIDPSLTKDQLLEFFTFKTANKTLSTADLAAVQKAAEGLIPLQSLSNYITGLSYKTIKADYAQIDAASQLLPISVNNTNEIIYSYSITGLNDPANNTIPIKFVVYNQANYNGTVYIYMHGLGSDKSSAQLLLQDIPYTVIAIDLPWHGDRVLPQDNPATPYCFENVSGSCYLTVNVALDRINLYQSIFDLRILSRALASGLIDLNGDGTPDTPSKIDFLGVSMGSIVGAPFVSRDPNISRAVLNVGGAGLTTMLDTGKNPLIQSMLSQLGVPKDSINYYFKLGVFQLLLDPADPVYLANATAGSKSILQTAYGDTVVSNVSNRILAETLGFNSSFDVTDPLNFNATANAAAGWYMFGNSSNWVVHAFLLNPDVSRYPNAVNATASYNENASKAARAQIRSFF